MSKLSDWGLLGLLLPICIVALCIPKNTQEGEICTQRKIRMHKIALAFLVTFCLGSIVGSALAAMNIISAKNSGYIEISGQTYKLVPVELKYVEKVE